MTALGKHITIQTLRGVLLITLAGLSQGSAEALETRLLNEWNNPDFLKSFTGDLGMRTDIEPSISPEEKALISDIVPKITQNPAQALAALDAQVSQNSSAALDYLQGHLSNVLGNRAQAAARYRKATEKFPNFLRAHKWLGHFYFEQEDFDQATQSYGRVVSLGGGDEFVHGRLAYCLLQQEQFVSAETAFRAASVANPKNPRWKTGLAQCFIQLEQPEAALVLLEEVLTQEPGIQSHWLLKANAHLAADQSLKALAALEAARRVGRARADILISIGDISLNEGLVGSAVESYIAALNENPDVAESGCLRAIESLLIRGETPAAQDLLASYEQLSSTRPTEEKRVQQEKLRLWLQLETADSDKAAQSLESYLESHPLDKESILRLAAYNMKHDHPTEAERLYRQALTLAKTDSRILIQLAQLQARQGNYPAALQSVRQALQTDNSPAIQSYADQLEAFLRESESRGD